MATFKTLAGTIGHGGIQTGWLLAPTDRTLVPVGVDLKRENQLDLLQGGITEDIVTTSQGLGGAVEGGTCTGAARAVAAGKDVVMVLSSSGRGSLAVQESTAGATGPWITAGVFLVVAGVVASLRFTPGAGVTHYRGIFTASEAASRVGLTSQNRS